MNAAQPIQMEIVPAAEADLPAISELAGVIWRACYPGIIRPAQIDYMLARMYAVEVMGDEIRSQGIRYDLLSVDGKPAGFAAYGPTDLAALFSNELSTVVGTPRRGVRTALPAVPTFKLHKLYLKAELHGRGLGSRLLQHVEHEVRRLGARRLILSVNKRNAKAIAAYQRNGFAVVESVVTDIGNGFVMDDYVLAKDLAD